MAGLIGIGFRLGAVATGTGAANHEHTQDNGQARQKVSENPPASAARLRGGGAFFREEAVRQQEPAGEDADEVFCFIKKGVHGFCFCRAVRSGQRTGIFLIFRAIQTTDQSTD
jgi:hypothetical protein